jgi:hypothetical protein
MMERRSQYEKEKRRRHRFASTAQARAQLQKSIWRANDRMWNIYLQNRMGAEVCWAVKFSMPPARATIQALTDRNGRQGNTITENEEMLRHESFPPNEHKQYL